MGNNRKSPLDGSKSRAIGAPLPTDSGAFSIETTTMRLKSLKLERQERDYAEMRMEQARKEDSPKPAFRSAWDPPKQAGRVRHDDRGTAVWEMAVATGEFAALSSTNIMRQLDTGGLSIEETQRELKAAKPVGRDVGGGGDPYNQRVSAARPGSPSQQKGGPPAPTHRKSGSVLDQLTGRKK